MSLLCFFAHHRSASSWANDILRSLCHAAGWHHRVVHNAQALGDDPAGFCRNNRVDLLTFSNACKENLNGLPPFKGLHLVRDPRDVLVSSYFAHRNSHPTDNWPELIEHRRELQSLSEQDGLLLELQCRQQQFADMYDWPYNSANILEKRMEDFIGNPEEHLIELFEFWGCLQLDRDAPYAPAQVFYNRATAWLGQRSAHPHILPRLRMKKMPSTLISRVATDHNYHNKSGGRATGVKDTHHHYRAGTPGDWRNHFFEELTAGFKTQYNDLLIRLGYEDNADW